MPHATVSLPTSPTNVALTPPVEARPPPPPLYHAPGLRLPPPPIYQVEGSTPQGYYLPPEASIRRRGRPTVARRRPAAAQRVRQVPPATRAAAEAG